MSYSHRPRTPTPRPQTPTHRPHTPPPQLYSHESNATNQNEIKCIKCSIKKLELDMKLTKEDSIDDNEFEKLINEIVSLCEECDYTEDEINKFTKDARMKRSMNKLGAFIKLATFIFPTLSNVNLVLTKLVKNKYRPNNDQIRKAYEICSSFVTYLLTGKNARRSLNYAGEFVEYVGKVNDANIIEYLVNPFESDILEPIIQPVTTIINDVISSISSEFFQKLSSYQKLILIVFISYLSVNILLNMAIYGDNFKVSKIYKDFTNFTNITGPDHFRLTGGKRSRQKKQQSSKKTTKAAKAAKAVEILKLKKPKLKRKN